MWVLSILAQQHISPNSNSASIKNQHKNQPTLMQLPLAFKYCKLIFVVFFCSHRSDQSFCSFPHFDRGMLHLDTSPHILSFLNSFLAYYFTINFSTHHSFICIYYSCIYILAQSSEQSIHCFPRNQLCRGTVMAMTYRSLKS